MSNIVRRQRPIMFTAKRLRCVAAVLGLLVGISLIGYAWVSAGEQVRLSREMEAAKRAKAALEMESARNAQMERERLARLEVLKRQIRVSVDLEEMANRAAVLHADAELRQAFAGYCNRTEAFAEEITSLKNRVRLTWTVVSDRIRGTAEAQAIVEEVFGQTVVSDAQLRENVLTIAGRFQGDLEANRNQMLTRVAHDFRLAQVPVTPATKSAIATQEVITQQLSGRISPASTDAALHGAAALAASWAVIVPAVTTVAAAAAEGAAIGAGAGTVVAPGIGSWAGLAAGAAAGMAIDRAADEHIRAQMVVRTCDALEIARHELWSNRTVGLQSRFDAAVIRNKATHMENLMNAANGALN